MKINYRGYIAAIPQSVANDGDFDEADWMEWEHWQSVEEIQDVMSGVANSLAQTDDGAEISDNPHRIASRLERFGIQVDG